MFEYESEQVLYWVAISDLFLTEEISWNKNFYKACGFTIIYIFTSVKCALIPEDKAIIMIDNTALRKDSGFSLGINRFFGIRIFHSNQVPLKFLTMMHEIFP